jgi:hypothetical protein
MHDGEDKSMLFDDAGYRAEYHAEPSTTFLSRVVHGSCLVRRQVHAGVRVCGVCGNVAIEEALNDVNGICDGSTHIPLTKQKIRTTSFLLPNIERSHSVLKNWNRVAPLSWLSIQTHP